MKKRLCLWILTLCLALSPGLFALAEAPLNSINSLDELWTENGFLPIAPYEWGDTIDEMLPSFPDSDKMNPSSEAFDEMSRRTNPENGFVSLYPAAVYRIDGVELPLSVIWEYDAEERLYGYWLTSGSMKLDALTEEDQAARVADVKAIVGALSEKREALFANSAIDLDALTFADFLKGSFRLFWLGADGTFCQLAVSAIAEMNLFSVSLGVGQADTWPAIREILNGLTK